jgi:hypothetical protein
LKGLIKDEMVEKLTAKKQVGSMDWRNEYSRRDWIGEGIGSRTNDRRRKEVLREIREVGVMSEVVAKKLK